MSNDESPRRRCVPCQRDNQSNMKGQQNLVAAGFSLMVLLLLSAALSEPNWFRQEGGACQQDYMGMAHYFLNSYQLEFKYNIDLKDRIADDCVTRDLLITLETCFILIVFAILFTVLQFVLDLLGPSSSVLRSLQVNAIANIITVLICVTVCGLSYWAAELLVHIQLATRTLPGRRVSVTFSAGFYLTVAAGAVSIVAVAANCFCQPLALLRAQRMRLHILSRYHQRSRLHQPSSSDLAMLIPPPVTPESSPSAASCRRPLPPAPDADDPPAYSP